MSNFSLNNGHIDFNSARFITCSRSLARPFDLDDKAPLFRKHFRVSEGITRATLSVCALGLGRLYINGKTFTDEIFISPVSNYNKTLWYRSYDVTENLKIGENLISAALGNGFYNESLTTDWLFHKAPWRDNPKLLLCLKLNYGFKCEYVLTDESWLCNVDDSPYRFNQFRMGEIYDFNRCTDWMREDFDDSSWEKAVFASPCKGTLRECPAEPITECELFPCKSVTVNKFGEYVLDFGQNLSGYIRLRTKQPSGTRLHISYAEQLCDDLRRRDNKLSRYYPDGETQFSTIITSDEAVDWRPHFSYYGFRYVIISGAVNPITEDDVQSVFVHQSLSERGSFFCSDELLNKIYNAARISTLSNAFNMLTDCPTREKLGWCNDAQASCEQTVQNYRMSGFYKKWMQDIFDSQRENGDLPGIAPTGLWGYDWGSGPVSTGILFEIPYRMWQYCGNKSFFEDAYPYMQKHLEFLESKINPENGLIEHGLDDWAGPWDEDKCPVSLGFVCTALYIRFCGITSTAAGLCGLKEEKSELLYKRERMSEHFQRTFMTAKGECLVPEQTALSLIIVNGLYKDLEILKKQLIKSVERYDYHFHVGMLGMQYILPALDICGLSDLGYRMLTAKGYPSYGDWFDNGATALHEMFKGTMSCNHHMYSCVIAWLHNTVLGIKWDASENRDGRVKIKPHFVDGLSRAEGRFINDDGEINVHWERVGKETVEVSIRLLGGVEAYLELAQGGDTLPLKNGKNKITVKA